MAKTTATSRLRHAGRCMLRPRLHPMCFKNKPQRAVKALSMARKPKAGKKQPLIVAWRDWPVGAKLERRPTMQPSFIDVTDSYQQCLLCFEAIASPAKRCPSCGACSETAVDVD